MIVNECLEKGEKREKVIFRSHLFGKKKNRKKRMKRRLKVNEDSKGYNKLK